MIDSGSVKWVFDDIIMNLSGKLRAFNHEQQNISIFRSCNKHFKTALRVHLHIT